MNKHYLTTALFLLLAVSCRKSNFKDRVPPIDKPLKMTYKNLGDVQIAFHNSYSCDVDDDGIKDFSITTEYNGKPAENIDCQGYFFNGASPVDPNEETPLLNSGDTIGNDTYPNHIWYNAAHLLLSEKVITMSGNDFWRGKWKDASHKYLAFSIEKNSKRHYGWLELSFSTNKGAVILHRAAIAEEAEKNVFAGK